MELQKQDLPEKGLQQNLAVAITTDKLINTSLIDKLKINIELKRFKTEGGGINYPAIFSIPKDQRIAGLAAKDLELTIQTITVGLTLAFETMNLTRAITSNQILDLAEVIVDESDSDNLSLEDLMLFLQKLVRGEYPGLYEGIDIPKFMERFGKYRDERWAEGVKIRDQKHEDYKRLGETKRIDSKNTALDEHLSQFTNKLGAMKDELKEKQSENKRLREQRDF